MRQVHRKSPFEKVLINPSVMTDMSSWSIKRVPLDFDWPVGYVWHGYVNPWPGPIGCEYCCETGLNDISLKLYRNFKRWAPRLTEDETAQALRAGISEKDLVQIRRRNWDDIDDSLIRSYLTEIHAKSTEVWGFCQVCNGKRTVPNPNPAIQQLYADVNLFEEWHPIEPPKGDGWQLWQIRETSGVPASVVYKLGVELARWCSTHFKSNYAGWLKWITKESFKVPQEPPEFKLKSENVIIFSQPVSKA